MTPFHIRPAVLADMPALRQLIEESVRHLNAADYSAAQIDSALRYLISVDTQLIEDGTYFVAEIDGFIVGSGGWSKRRRLHGGQATKRGDDENELLDPATDPAKMRNFFVHPQAARQGIGRTLLSVSENAAVQAGFVQLELMATLTGEPLYASSGYEVVERQTLTLPDGTPFQAAHMVKTVEQRPLTKVRDLFLSIDHR